MNVKPSISSNRNEFIFFKVFCTSSLTSLYSELRIVLDNSYLEGILKAGEAFLINAQKSSFSSVIL